jgi:hypothetical protein
MKPVNAPPVRAAVDTREDRDVETIREIKSAGTLRRAVEIDHFTVEVRQFFGADSRKNRIRLLFTHEVEA